MAASEHKLTFLRKDAIVLSSSAGLEASSGVEVPAYVRHHPERTHLFYQLVEEYYPAFKAHLASQDTELPGYVEREFEEYLKCGVLGHGFLRVHCDIGSLAESELGATFSVFCGSRRMTFALPRGSCQSMYRV